MKIKPRQLEIIEATGKILTQSGVNGLTIKRLADEMNFSESAIYRHFESKEDIILTLLKYLTQNISTILDKIPCTSNADEDLKTVFRRITVYFKENPYFAVAVFSEGLLDESLRVRDTIMNLVGMMTRHLLSIIERGQQENKFITTIVAGDLAQIVLATYKQLMFTWRFQNFEFNITKSVDKMTDTFLLILKNHPD